MKFLPLLLVSILLLLSGFSEFVVFNEEILLALCFVSFVFFAYSYLNETVYTFFSDYAAKIETDLVTSFQARYNSILVAAKGLVFSFKLANLLTLLELVSLSFVHFRNSKALSKRSNEIVTVLQFKLNDLVIKRDSFSTKLQITKIKNIILPLAFRLRSLNTIKLIP